MDSNWTSPTDCASSVCNPHDTSVGCCQAVKISRTQPVSLTSWHVPLSLETEKKIRRTHGRRPSPFGRAQPTPAASVHVAAMSAAAAIARASIKAATRAGTDCKPARRLTGQALRSTLLSLPLYSTAHTADLEARARVPGAHLVARPGMGSLSIRAANVPRSAANV